MQWISYFKLENKPNASILTNARLNTTNGNGIHSTKLHPPYAILHWIDRQQQAAATHMCLTHPTKFVLRVCSALFALYQQIRREKQNTYTHTLYACIEHVWVNRRRSHVIDTLNYIYSTSSSLYDCMVECGAIHIIAVLKNGLFRLY